MTENAKTWLMLSVVGVSYATLVLVAGLAGQVTGYWSQEQPLIYRSEPNIIVGGELR